MCALGTARAQETPILRPSKNARRWSFPNRYIARNRQRTANTSIIASLRVRVLPAV